MSHNITKVNSQEPDRVGAITQALSDLSDVSTTGVANGDLVAGASSGFDVASPILNRVASIKGLTYSGVGYTTTQFNIAFSGSEGWYDNLRRTYSTPSTLLETSSSSQVSFITRLAGGNPSAEWIKGLLLAPGYKYQIEYDVILPSNCSTDAFVEVQWGTSGGAQFYGPRAFFARSQTKRSKARAFVDLSSAAAALSIGMYLHSQGGTIYYIQNGVDSKQITCTVRVLE